MPKKPTDDLDFTQNDSASYSRYTFGDPLKQARTKTNLTLERVATDLNIRIDYLRAIENNNPQGLPEPVFTMGFVRSYAKYLNMDPQVLVDLYKREVLGYGNEWANIPTPSTIPSAPRSWIITGAAGIVLASYGLWFFMHRTPEPNLKEQALAPTSVEAPKPEKKKKKRKKSEDTVQTSAPSVRALPEAPAAATATIPADEAKKASAAPKPSGAPQAAGKTEPKKPVTVAEPLTPPAETAAEAPSPAS